jgi:hypothetical protein
MRHPSQNVNFDVCETELEFGKSAPLEQAHMRPTQDGPNLFIADDFCLLAEGDRVSEEAIGLLWGDPTILSVRSST